MNLYTKGDEIKATKEQLAGEILPKIMDNEPNRSAFKTLIECFKTVCPRGLADIELVNAIEMESFCRDYGVPPYESDKGYLDYPRKVIDAFALVSMARERVRSEEQEKAINKSKEGKK